MVTLTVAETKFEQFFSLNFVDGPFSINILKFFNFITNTLSFTFVVTTSCIVYEGSLTEYVLAILVTILLQNEYTFDHLVRVVKHVV